MFPMQPGATNLTRNDSFPAHTCTHYIGGDNSVGWDDREVLSKSEDVSGAPLPSDQDHVHSRQGKPENGFDGNLGRLLAHMADPWCIWGGEEIRAQEPSQQSTKIWVLRPTHVPDD